MKLVKISHGIIRSVLESSNYELSTGIYDISGNDFISKKMNGGWKHPSDRSEQNLVYLLHSTFLELSKKWITTGSNLETQENIIV